MQVEKDHYLSNKGSWCCETYSKRLDILKDKFRNNLPLDEKDLKFVYNIEHDKSKPDCPVLGYNPSPLIREIKSYKLKI